MTYLTCPHCGRVVAASGKAHIAACAPEAREARRLRAIGFSARYRARRPARVQTYRGWTVPDVYLSHPSDLVACPECAGPMTATASVCIACRRRLGRRKRPLAERLWAMVDQSAGADGCWPFLGVRDPNGYGRMSIRRGRTQIASQVAWFVTNGDLGALHVLHHCDNPPCCNPAHLFLGTQADNHADMVSKGRASWQKRAAS